MADRSSTWVDRIFHYRLWEFSIWTISDRTGTWGWRKLVQLWEWLRPVIFYRVGDGTTFSLWHDPWHERGPLILQFPLGPRCTAISDSALLCTVIRDGGWNRPAITDIESIDITHSLPTIHVCSDCILWTGPGGSFSSSAAYTVFAPAGPKVGWSSLLVGTFKIPRHRFILWVAILGRLSTLDRPWLQHMGTSCVLCQDGIPETHEHLLFTCSFAVECLQTIRGDVSFHWPYNNWPLVIQWTSRRWRGKHVVNTSLRALLAALVYHLWQERNRRIFQHSMRTPIDIARTVVSDIRDLIIVNNFLELLAREDSIDYGGSLGLSR
ncbi:UNVERIFIED_CONTAM: hypothetical protein Sradi_1774300 [Sesamum radiatum]|uniref:Reverse transcriptase zinc-binding domain-containing protein n=1 Tax=Sesamum radiatum TaxID=300843 RepID=A0AAW2TUP3_SESRA